MPDLCKVETQAGAEIQAGAYTLVPFVKTWRWQPRTGQAGFVWNRPAAILARSADGQEQVLPVPDLTLRVLLSLLGVCLGATLLMLVIPLIRRK